MMDLQRVKQHIHWLFLPGLPLSMTQSFADNAPASIPSAAGTNPKTGEIYGWEDWHFIDGVTPACLGIRRGHARDGFYCIDQGLFDSPRKNCHVLCQPLTYPSGFQIAASLLIEPQP